MRGCYQKLRLRVPSNTRKPVFCVRGLINNCSLEFRPTTLDSRNAFEALLKLSFNSFTRQLQSGELYETCSEHMRFRVPSGTHKLVIWLRSVFKSWDLELHPTTVWDLEFHQAPANLWIVWEVLSTIEVRALTDTLKCVSCMRGVINGWALEFHPRRVSELHEKHCPKLRFRVPSDTYKLVNCI